MNKKQIVIATRESRLALCQANFVKTALEQRGFKAKLLSMTTEGDQRLDSTLAKIGGKGLFIKEIELALIRGDADIAVHSLKDIPMDLPSGFMLASILKLCGAWGYLNVFGSSIATAEVTKEIEIDDNDAAVAIGKQIASALLTDVKIKVSL